MSFFSSRPKDDILPPDDFLARRTDDDLVLDVRTPTEFATGHLVGAINVDVMAPDFRTRIAEFDRDQTVYLYCRSGNRSGQAAGILKELGFAAAHNVGGFDALAQAGALVQR